MIRTVGIAFALIAALGIVGLPLAIASGFVTRVCAGENGVAVALGVPGRGEFERSRATRGPSRCLRGASRRARGFQAKSYSAGGKASASRAS